MLKVNQIPGAGESIKVIAFIFDIFAATRPYKGDMLPKSVNPLHPLPKSVATCRRFVYISLHNATLIPGNYHNTNMLTALLFDLDGTLADTDPIHFHTWRDILCNYGLEIDRPFYQTNFSGRLNAAIVQDLLPHLSIEEGQQLSERKEAEFRQRAAQQLQPLAGLLNLLSWANTQNLKQAVVTNAPKENAQFMLQVLGLENSFTTVVLAEELPKGKPDPLPYQEALQQLGVSSQSAVAFEDSPSGIRSAVSAGILTVGIASTHDPQDLYAVGATLVIEDFADSRLEELLKFSWQQVTAELATTPT